jgi:hypothetical protein
MLQSHTSKFTTEELKKLEDIYGVQFISKKEIPVKACDASPCDFFAFGFLKQKLKQRKAKTLNGLLKVANQVWQEISVDMIRRVYDNWRKRLKLINLSEGCHIENVKDIHNRLVKL